jgi:uncharacterized protein YjiS (DUF1127 family)
VTTKSTEVRARSGGRTTRWLLRLLRTILNRRQVIAMLEMDEHELNDVGLSRHDVRQVLKLPLWVDPTAPLNELARRRIAGQDAAPARCGPSTIGAGKPEIRQ